MEIVFCVLCMHACVRACLGHRDSFPAAVCHRLRQGPRTFASVPAQCIPPVSVSVSVCTQGKGLAVELDAQQSRADPSARNRDGNLLPNQILELQKKDFLNFQLYPGSQFNFPTCARPVASVIILFVHLTRLWCLGISSNTSLDVSSHPVIQ